MADNIEALVHKQCFPRLVHSAKLALADDFAFLVFEAVFALTFAITIFSANKC